MNRHTFTVYVSGKPTQRTVTEYTFPELCNSEVREVLARGMPQGPDVRYHRGAGGWINWRRVSDNA
jgi:hypothetical protein